MENGYIDGAITMVHLHQQERAVLIVKVILLYVVIIVQPSSKKAAAWKVRVENQNTTCLLYTHKTKTCFMQSHVGGRVDLQLHLTPTSVAESTTPPDISWYRRVKMRYRHSLALVNLLEGGRPPDDMELSENRTRLTIKILSEYDMSRNSFKARVEGLEKGDYQNFVIETEPVEIEAPAPGAFAAINTMDYFTIPGRNAHFDWSKEGARFLPRNIALNPDGKRLIIRHYLPAEDSGVYVCDVYSPENYFIAGRRFIIGSAKYPDTDLVAQGPPTNDYLYAYEHSAADDIAFYNSEPLKPEGRWIDNIPDLDVDPLRISEMLHTFKNNGDTEYILKGRTQYLACLPSNMRLVKTLAPGLVFEWDRPQDSDVITTLDPGRYRTIDGGILEIANVLPKDSGKLECKVSYHDSIGKTREKIYTYGIEVYTLPDLVYAVTAAYTADVCSSEQQKAVFQQRLGTHLQSFVIPDAASFEIANLIADCKHPGPSTAERLGVDSVALVNFDVVVRHGMLTHCSRMCMVGEMETKMRMVGMKLAAFFSQEHEYGALRPVLGSVRLSLKYRCEEGYGLHASICIACKPGSYSESGSTECVQCPGGTYQPAYGAVECIPCPAGESTYWHGADSAEDCQPRTVIMGSILGAFGLMVLVGLVVWVVLYRIERHSIKKATQDSHTVSTSPQAAVVKAIKDVAKRASEKLTKDVAKRGSGKLKLPELRMCVSASDISSSMDDNELAWLLEDYDGDDDDIKAALDDIRSQQHQETPVAEQTHAQKLVIEHGTVEPRQELEERALTQFEKYPHREKATSQYNSIQANVDYQAQSRTVMELTPVDPRDTHKPHHTVEEQRQREDQFDHFARSRTVKELAPIDEQHLGYAPVDDSPRHQYSGKTVLRQPRLPSVAHLTPKHSSRMGPVSQELPLEPYLITSPEEAFTLQPSQAHLSPKSSSRIGPASQEYPLQAEILSAPRQKIILEPSQAHLSPKHSYRTELATRESSLQPQLAIPSHQPLILQEGISPSERYQSSSSDISSDVSPPVTLSPSPEVSPDVSPHATLSPSVIYRPNSLASPSKTLTVSSMSSTLTHTKRKRSLSSAGPSSPVSDRSRRSSEFIPPGSLTIPAEFSDSETEIEIRTYVAEEDHVLPREESFQSPVFPKPKQSPRGSSVAALIASFQSISQGGPRPPSPPPAQQVLHQSSLRVSSPKSHKRSSITLDAQSDTSTGKMLFVSLPLSPGTAPGNLEKSLSVYSRKTSSHVTESAVSEHFSIATLSPPRTPQKDRSRTFTPTGSKELNLSEPSPEPNRSTPQLSSSPARAPSIQESLISSRESLITRRSSHLTSPAGRPVNPFKLQQLRRQSLAAQRSSHLTLDIPSAFAFPKPQIEAVTGHVPPPPNVTSSPSLAPPTLAPPPTMATPPAEAPPPNVAPSPLAPPPRSVPPPVVAPSTTVAPPVATPSALAPPLHLVPPPIVTPPPAEAPPPTLAPPHLAPPPRVAPPPAIPPPSTTPPGTDSSSIMPPPMKDRPAAVAPPPPPHPTNELLPQSVTLPSAVAPPSVASPTPAGPTSPTTAGKAPTAQATAAPHPVAALINTALTSRKGPKFLTPEPVKEASRTKVPSTTPTVPASVLAPPAFGTILAPPPPPPPPPLLEE